MYYLAFLVGSVVGNHKYWTHEAFEANPWAEIVMLIGAVIGHQGHPIIWVNGHHHHHNPDTVDTDKDPLYRGRKTGNPFRAIFVNHTFDYASDGLDKKATRKMLKNPRAMFFAKAMPLMALWPIGLFALGGLSAAVWLWALPVVASLFVCGAVIIRCHDGKTGYAPYPMDDSRNLSALWRPFSCGEELQNNHHHDPEAANFAFREDEWDASHWMVKLLQKSPRVVEDKDRLVPDTYMHCAG